MDQLPSLVDAPISVLLMLMATLQSPR